MRFTAKVKENGQVTIPAPIRELYDIKITDFVEVEMIRVNKK